MPEIQQISLHASAMGPFVMLLFVIGAVWVILMLAGATKRGRTSTFNGPRICPNCSMPNPPHARFCRSCGAKV